MKKHLTIFLIALALTTVTLSACGRKGPPKPPAAKVSALSATPGK